MTTKNSYSFFGFKSNIPYNVEIDNANEGDIEEKLNAAFDAKKIKVDYYTKEDNQNRIMNIEFVA